MEDTLGGLGIGPDVELGRGGHVPLSDRTAHQHDPRDVGASRALEQERDIRQRTGRDERHGDGARRDRLGHELDRVGAERRSDRRRQRRPVEAALAVDVRRDGQVPDEGPVGARRDRDVAPADELQHPERIGSRLLERLVAVHRRHPEHVELRAAEREQQRDRVVVAGIAVEDDRSTAVHAIHYRGPQPRL